MKETRTVCTRTVLALTHWLRRAWRRLVYEIEQAQYRDNSGF